MSLLPDIKLKENMGMKETEECDNGFGIMTWSTPSTNERDPLQRETHKMRWRFKINKRKILPDIL